MSQLPILRRRIRSVSSTRQITKAMEMVAASKLRRAEIAAREPKPYLETLGALLGRLQTDSIVTQGQPLYQERPIKAELIIVVTADRGLAGAYNTAITKLTRQFMAEHAVGYRIIGIGRRGSQHLAQLSGVTLTSAYDVEPSQESGLLPQAIGIEAIRQFTGGEADAVHLAYTQYTSTIRQTPVIEQLLPLVPQAQTTTESQFEPGLAAVIEATSRRYVEARIAQAIADSRASEQAARMVAMMNATENAAGLIDDLTLEYQDSRQAAITQELAEITAATEAASG